MILPLAACIAGGLVAGKLLPVWIGQSALVRAGQTALLVGMVGTLGMRLGVQQASHARWGRTLLRSVALALGAIVGAVAFALPCAGWLVPAPVRDALPGEVSSPARLLALAMTALAVGAAFGVARARAFDAKALGRHAFAMLCAMMVLVGIDGGSSPGVEGSVMSISPWLLVVPVLIALGSVAGGCVAGLVLGLPAHAGAAVGAGCGWYSFTTIQLGELGGAELASYGLLANMFREALALVAIPVIARWHRGVVLLAPPGCAAMDTAFGMLGRLGGDRMGVLAFLTGAICSLMVPALVRVAFRYFPKYQIWR